MIESQEIKEIRNHLSNSMSPLFYFDNDQDGLCSYLLLRRLLGRGNGVPVKTSPLNESYYRRVKEFNPDVVFILDQPTVSLNFLEELNRAGIKIVWIDHHEKQIEGIPSYVHYFNPLYSGEKENLPVTAICYEISKRKQDLWLAVIGTISDKFVLSFYKDFMKDYPDLSLDSSDAFEIFYNSDIGKIARMLGIGLKDRTTEVIRMVRFLYSAKSPYDVLEESKETTHLHSRFKKINLKFNKYIEKAKLEYSGENLLFFKYSGETSMSADIANKLSYLYPKNYIVVAFVKGSRVNLSLRGDNIRKSAIKVIEKFPLATCGGHENAVGAQLNLEQLDNFVLELRKLVN